MKINKFLDIHNYINIILILSFILSIISIRTDKHYNQYVDFLNWGKKNNIFIDGIFLNFSQGNDTFIANKDINPEDIIMEIPKDILITFDKAYSLSNKKYKQIYDDLEEKANIPVMMSVELKKQVFLALKLSKGYEQKKGKFYEKYKPFIEFNRLYKKNYPIFYPEDILNEIKQTHLGKVSILAKQSLLNENSYINDNFDIYSNDEEFLQYRTMLESQCRMTNNRTIILIPFISYFKYDPVIYNAYDEYDEINQKLVIRAKKSIKNGDVIRLKSLLQDITSNLLYLGYAPEAKKKNHFPIMYLSDELRTKYNYDKDIEHNKIDLAEKNYINKALAKYKNISKEIGGDGSQIAAANLFLENLNSYYLPYKIINFNKLEDIARKFKMTEYSIDNIKRVINLEIKTLENSINDIKDVIKSLEKRKKEKEEEKNKSDNDDISDL